VRSAEARAKGFDTVIVDSAGRLHIDDDLMNELQAIKDVVKPSDLLYCRRLDDRSGRHQERG
jgi:signal recognition particle GTPase